MPAVRAWLVGALLLLLAVGGPAVSAQAPQYPNLLAALAPLQCATFSGIVTNVTAGYTQSVTINNVPYNQVTLQQLLSDPTLQVILLAPKDAAMQKITQDYPLVVSVSYSPESYFLFASFFIIPIGSPQAQLPVKATGNNRYPVLQTMLGGISGQDPSSYDTSITLVPTADPDIYWAGGLPPGALVNISQSYTAGQARIYLLDTALVPAAAPLQQGQLIAGLTMQEGLQSSVSQDLTTMNSLVAADPELLAYLSDPDNPMTVLAPRDVAFQSFFFGKGTTVNAVKGSSAVRELLKGHIFPGRPYSTSTFPASGIGLVGLDPNITVVASSTPTQSGPVITFMGSRNTVPASIFKADIAAGKGVLHVIDSVLVSGPFEVPVGGPGPAPSPGASPSSPVRSPAPAPAPTPVVLPPASPNASSSSSGSKDNTRVVVGAVVGAVGGTILLLALAVLGYLHMTRHRRRGLTPSKVGGPFASTRRQDLLGALPSVEPASLAGRPTDAHGVLVYSGLSGVPAPAKPGALLLGATSKSGTRTTKPGLQVQGLIFGDPFLRSTAPQYSWTDRKDEDCVGVVAHINDHQLDKFATKAGPPVIRLSRAEVVQQLRLLNTGLLGKGASALVFKGLWPSRFGPNALLAIKVLKDPYEADPTAYEGFCYEAAVLASVRHPNVLRMYGYCLELPTACLIMELLPSSLKDKLYSRAHSMRKDQSSRTRSSINRVVSPVQATPTIMTSPMVPTGQPNQNSGSLANGPGPGTQQSNQSAPNPTANGSDVAVNVKPVSLSVTEGARAHPEGQKVVDVGSGVDITFNHSLNHHDKRGVSLDERRVNGNASKRSDGRLTANDVSHNSEGAPPSTSSSATFISNRLTILEVLQLSADVAAGLAYLHKRPAVVALPAHPTMILTPDPMAPAADSEPVVDENAKDEDGCMSIARIVHRDLKPSNILINSHGRAKISDFGLARWHSSSTVYTQHLGVGTLRYLAPELLLGHYKQPNAPPITNRVDIYSLGVMMWEMLSHQPPWHDLSDAQIVAAVMAGLRPPISPPPQAAPPSCDGDKPATFETLPHFHPLITTCWHERDLHRPKAADVHDRILALIHTYGGKWLPASKPLAAPSSD